MIIGDPAVFAIESEITKAYERLSFRALGLFVIHLKSCRYGVYEPDATMLAASFDAVVKRISNRGSHSAIFSNEADPVKIANAFRGALYAKDPSQTYFGMPTADFVSFLGTAGIQWAPDGDEAFDDGSYVLQFDVIDRVRLIGFRSKFDGGWDPVTLTEVWIASNDFYAVLKSWRDWFLEEWSSQPKIAEL